MIPTAEAMGVLEAVADRCECADAIPVDVVSLSSLFGVRIRREHLRHGKALLVQGEDDFEIVLPSYVDATGYTMRERFQIAHELGHVILLKRFQVRPFGPEEYWQHEKLCDAFARKVLLPRRLVERTVGQSKLSPLRRLRDADCLARKAEVPWAAAAARLTDNDSRTAFLKVFGLQRDAEWQARVRFSSLPNQRGLHTKIDAMSDLGRFLARLPTGLNRCEISCDLLDDIRVREGVSAAGATRPSMAEVRIALIL